MLGLVIDRIRRLPVLLVITFRPEFTPPWPGYRHITSFTLSRLGQRQGATMVARLTAGAGTIGAPQARLWPQHALLLALRLLLRRA